MKSRKSKVKSPVYRSNVYSHYFVSGIGWVLNSSIEDMPKPVLDKSSVLLYYAGMGAEEFNYCEAHEVDHRIDRGSEIGVYIRRAYPEEISKLKNN